MIRIVATQLFYYIVAIATYVDVEDSSSVEDVTSQYSARGRGGRRRSRLSVPVNQYSFYSCLLVVLEFEARSDSCVVKLINKLMN